MKRLREMHDDDVLRGRGTEPVDPLLRQAQQLLSAVEPLAPSQERMRQVRRGMEEKRAARSAGILGMLRGPRALALSALLVFGGSTLAAAQTGALRAVIARVSQVIQLTPAPVPAAPKREHRPPARHAAAPLAPAAETVPVVTAVEPALPATEERIAPERPSPEPRHRVHARPAQPRGADNEIVRRAVKALRRDGDPALAGRLLEDARLKSPNGVLAEEVMSLRVEAALARGDARARAYAHEYLARYPEGRYRSQVERALAR